MAVVVRFRCPTNLEIPLKARGRQTSTLLGAQFPKSILPTLHPLVRSLPYLVHRSSSVLDLLTPLKVLRRARQALISLVRWTLVPISLQKLRMESHLQFSLLTLPSPLIVPSQVKFPRPRLGNVRTPLRNICPSALTQLPNPARLLLKPLLTQILNRVAPCLLQLLSVLTVDTWPCRRLLKSGLIPSNLGVLFSLHKNRQVNVSFLLCLLTQPP